MTKAQYKQARKLVRENGRYALNWLKGEVRHAFTQLRHQHRDDLADKADFFTHMRKTKCEPQP